MLQAVSPCYEDGSRVACKTSHLPSILQQEVGSGDQIGRVSTYWIWIWNCPISERCRVQNASKCLHICLSRGSRDIKYFNPYFRNFRPPPTRRPFASVGSLLYVQTSRVGVGAILNNGNGFWIIFVSKLCNLLPQYKVYKINGISLEWDPYAMQIAVHRCFFCQFHSIHIPHDSIHPSRSGPRFDPRSGQVS